MKIHSVVSKFTRMDKYTAYGTITKIVFGDSSEVLNLGLLRCDDVESGRHVLYLSTVL